MWPDKLRTRVKSCFDLMALNKKRGVPDSKRFSIMLCYKVRLYEKGRKCNRGIINTGLQSLIHLLLLHKRLCEPVLAPLLLRLFTKKDIHSINN